MVGYDEFMLSPRKDPSVWPHVWGYLPPEAALVAGLTNGIPEVIVACIIVVAVVGAWKGIETRRAGSTV